MGATQRQLKITEIPTDRLLQLSAEVYITTTNAPMTGASRLVCLGNAESATFEPNQQTRSQMIAVGAAS